MITGFDLRKGDCLELMKKLGDESIDMICCDLPYGSTKNKWDCPIDLNLLWEQYKRIIKPNGAIVLFAQTPFDKVLGVSNLEMLKYEWIWKKDNATGFLNSNFAPLKIHENILVFSKASAAFVKDKSKAMHYYPIKESGKPYTVKQGSRSKNYDAKNMIQGFETKNTGDRFPKSILHFKRDKDKLHPTQKPVALLEYLIKTYTKEGEIVLDNCMGSGSTGVACLNTNRQFIGMELDEKYYNIAIERLNVGN